ncbi:MGMT family protein [bacterium]|nr:MGMT family protein [bacterium]
MNLKNIQKKIESYSLFCRRVWAVTAAIPSGQVRSYQWVANKIGNPRSVRAVGQALSKNPFPIIIPCHRVICKNGKLGGFSRGVKKKESLLKREGVLCYKTGSL